MFLINFRAIVVDADPSLTIAECRRIALERTLEYGPIKAVGVDGIADAIRTNHSAAKDFSPLSKTALASFMQERGKAEVK